MSGPGRLPLALPGFSRREVLVAGVSGVGAACLPGCSAPVGPCRVEIADSLFDEPEDGFVPLMRWLSSGESPEMLYAAAVAAAARAIPPTVDGHSLFAVRAAHLLAQRQARANALIPLFWAWDEVQRGHAQQLVQGTEPIPPPDRAAWPNATNAATVLIDAWENWDPDVADAAMSALYAARGRDGVIDPIVLYGQRNQHWVGHKAIWAAYGLRTLDDFGWDACAPWILRNLARTFASEAEMARISSFEESRGRLPDVASGWRDGVDAADAVEDLLATFRTGDADACVDAVLDALADGRSTRTLWTALSLNAVELGVRWREGSFGVHQLDTTNALRHLQDLAGDDDTAALCLLQAASWVPEFRHYLGDDPPIDEGLDTLTPAEGSPTLDEALNSIASGVTDASRNLLAWMNGGGSLDVLTATWAEVIAVHAPQGDQHWIKYHAALLEDADAVLPQWRGRLLLGIPLRSPSPLSPRWERFDEAQELIASL